MKHILICLLLSCWAWSTGCSALSGPQADPQSAKELAPLKYPANAPLGPDLDILVILQDEGRIELVNRTPQSYHDLYLWLNQEWVGKVGSIRIGTGNTADLNKFINRFSEPYPFGSLLQPEKLVPIVLAELYDPANNVRYRLLARRTGL